MTTPQMYCRVSQSSCDITISFGLIGDRLRIVRGCLVHHIIDDQVPFYIHDYSSRHPLFISCHKVSDYPRMVACVFRMLITGKLLVRKDGDYGSFCWSFKKESK